MLGDSVVDQGSPFGASSTLGPGGRVQEIGASRVGGYTIVSAESMEDAIEKAKGSPHRQTGGVVEIYESVDPAAGM